MDSSIEPLLDLDLTFKPLAILDELYQEGKLSTERHKKYKEKFNQLYQIYTQTQENEIKQRKAMQSLNKELLKKKEHVEDETRKAHVFQDEIIQLREEFEKAEAKLGDQQEEEGKLEMERIEYERHKERLEDELESKRAEATEQITPYIDNLRHTLQDLTAETEEMSKRKHKLEEELKRAENTIEEADIEIAKLKDDLEEARRELKTIGRAPERMAKQAENFERVCGLSSSELAKQQEKDNQLEQVYRNQLEKIKQMKELRNKLYKATETYSLACHNLEQQRDEIRLNLEKENERANNVLADSVEINIQLDAAKTDWAAENSKLKRLQNENNTTSQTHKNIEKSINNIKEYCSRLKAQMENANYEYESILEKKNKNHSKLTELNKEMDITMNAYLKKEGSQFLLNDKFNQTYEETQMLEEELQRAMDEDRILANSIITLGRTKDDMAREASNDFRRYQESENQVIVSMGLIVDLRKRYQEVKRRLKQQTELYQTMKQDRTKYLTLNQESAQALAEIREQNKVLENEIEVLKNDSFVCDSRLKKVTKKKNKDYERIEKLRSNLNAKRTDASQKESEIKEQTLEINKLNTMIDRTEEEMLRTKQEYERIVEDRNQTGISLIDRNDELCILYEKSTMQESILVKGDVEMRQREQEIKMLTLELRDVTREIQVANKMLPKLNQLVEENKGLVTQYEEERNKVVDLSKKLEDPSNGGRWRDLEGKLVDKKALKEQLQNLEEQLNLREEQAMEKKITLEDQSMETDKSKSLVEKDRESNLELALKMNESQAKLNKQTREMKALLSELSINQARAEQLADSKRNKEQFLEIALQRVKEGLAPTSDADEEYERMQRREQRELERIRERKQKLEELRNMPATVVRTTAERRPNAYIPDDGLGLPQPYFMPPFKPSEPGSTMRHIRKPQPKKIEI